MALGSWANGPYVVTSVAIYMGAEDPFAGALNLPQRFHEDRKKMWRKQFDTEALGPRLAGYRSQLDAHTAFLVQQLADGRAFMTGARPGWADLHAMWDPGSCTASRRPKRRAPTAAFRYRRLAGAPGSDRPRHASSYRPRTRWRSRVRRHH